MKAYFEANLLWRGELEVLEIPKPLDLLSLMMVLT